MTIEGVDYGAGRPGGAALAAAGKHFAVRYVPYGGYAKGLDAAELADLVAHGIAVALIFESIANRTQGGIVTGPDLEYAAARHVAKPTSVTPAQAGAADAWKSQQQIGALHMDPTMPVYFAVDFDTTTAAQLASIDAYLKGAGSVIGAARVGIYGEASVINHTRAAGTAHWYWQTYAWSGGVVASGLHLLQYSNGHSINGASVDYDRAYVADFGQYPRPTQEDVMVITVEKFDPARVWHVAAGTNGLAGFALDTNTGALSQSIAPRNWTSSSWAHCSARYQIAGKSYLLVTDGVYAHALIPEVAGITVDPAPAPDCSAIQAQLDSATAQVKSLSTDLAAAQKRIAAAKTALG